MKDSGDRFIRKGSKEDLQPDDSQLFKGYATPPPAPPPMAPPEPKPEPGPKRPPPPPSRPSLLAIPAGRRQQAPVIVVARASVSVWGDRSFLADRIGQVSSGETLTVVEDVGPWLSVRSGTKLAGWVRAGELGAQIDPYAGLGERTDLI